jgi:uncharacterized protein YecE (DUF72 family)
MVSMPGNRDFWVGLPSPAGAIQPCATRARAAVFASNLAQTSRLKDSGNTRNSRAPFAVLSFLREHKLVHVVVDEPQGFGSSAPAVWEVTAPSLAIVRFHGRNKDTWEKKGLASATERFNYLYSEAELRDLAAHVIELAENAQETHALFNNCYRDFGQRNAIDFQLLRAAGSPG